MYSWGMGYRYVIWVWHRGVINYLQKRSLASKDIHTDIIATLRDDAPGLSAVQKSASELTMEMMTLEVDLRSAPQSIVCVPYMVMNHRYIPWERWKYSAQWTLDDESFCSVCSTSLDTRFSAHRMILSRENLKLFDPAGFLQRFLTRDVCWLHYFATKRQSMQWRRRPGWFHLQERWWH